MTTMTHIRAKVTPWDDPAFVRAFESARGETARAGVTDPPRAAAQVEHLLHEAGYAHARVDVVRTVEEALDQSSHWIVKRDG